MNPAVLSVSPGYGFAALYPTAGQVMTGSFRGRHELAQAVETLLDNGFAWTVLVGQGEERLAGVLEFMAREHGARFEEAPVPAVSDTELKRRGWWRRGAPESNDAARLLVGREEGTQK